ncbi:MAG: mammalian cell entry protein [Mycolicibacterium fortuitum]
MGNDAASTRTLSAPSDDEDAPGAECLDEIVDYETASTSTELISAARWHRLWHPVAFGLVAVALLSVLIGWLGYQTYRHQQTQHQGALFLQAARQGAVNLTTIDWQHAETDVQRIMDGAAGEFYDDFAQRAQPFVDVVKQAQSVSVGTVTQAALESQSATEAQALVAVSVKTTNTTGEEPVPRAWRMRIAVQQIDNQIKVSRVEFVP